MTSAIIIILIIIFIAFMVWFINAASKFGGLTPSSRETHFNNHVKPAMKGIAEVSHTRRKEAHKAGIHGYWHKKIKRAGGAETEKGRRFLKFRETELDLHERLYSAKSSHPALPKVDQRTGHTTGGVGRAGHKHSHHMPRSMRPKTQKKAKVPKAVKRSLKDIIIGDSGNWRGKK